METLLQQGPSGLGDWVEIIVVVLIFGGSALGALAKWIIAKLNPETPEKLERAEEDKPERQAAPARPVARPMPPVAFPARPVARPMPPQPVAQRPAGGEWVFQDPSRPTARQPLDEPRRAAPESPRPPAPVVPPVVIRVEPAASRPARSVARKAKRHIPKTTARTPERDLREEGDREFDRLDHQVWDVDTPDSKAALVVVEVCDEFDPIRRPTRRSLRRAIIMKEILGPPLALRPRDESF